MQATQEHIDLAESWIYLDGKPRVVQELARLIDYTEDRARRLEREAIAASIVDMSECDGVHPATLAAALKIISDRARAANEAAGRVNGSAA